MVREFPGCVIMPGLVNAHTHLELTHFPSWKLRKGIDYSPRTYVDWLIQVGKVRRALTHDELIHSVREGLHKSLESGTTSIGEIVTDQSLLPLYHESPLSGRLFCEAIGHEPARCAAFLSSAEELLSSSRRDRLLPGLSPHAPHTLSSSFMQEVSALALRHSVPAVIHVAESREEILFIHDSSGKISELLYPFVGWASYIPQPRRATPVAYLDSLGVLNPMTTAIHCVHVTQADAEILKQRNVTVVLCPRSNNRLAVGRAPVALLKKAGVALALGTDSLASNDSISMWDEMRFLLKEFPGVFTPDEVLRMATAGGAQALSIGGETGALDKMKRADFLVVRPAHIPSVESLSETLIGDSHLERVFIGGEPLFLDN
jgi:cytosine/adenosine deaminase-related metal-dependent hydrolase